MGSVCILHGNGVGTAEGGHPQQQRNPGREPIRGVGRAVNIRCQWKVVKAVGESNAVDALGHNSQARQCLGDREAVPVVVSKISGCSTDRERRGYWAGLRGVVIRLLIVRKDERIETIDLQVVVSAARSGGRHPDLVAPWEQLRVVRDHLANDRRSDSCDDSTAAFQTPDKSAVRRRLKGDCDVLLRRKGEPVDVAIRAFDDPAEPGFPNRERFSKYGVIIGLSFRIRIGRSKWLEAY